MKVYQLSEEEKKIAAAFQAKQAEITKAQAELNGQVKTAMEALCAKAGLKLPVALSECGNFVVEARSQR